ncbi:ATP-grasp domain-containing protein [Longispora sp. K20-0274]|uniref:ATP-grasp domain-containing protein n=1 Tax=Longispora sp. K20-0274 TaxID=3088255 RepID=UPI00399B7FBB
MSATFVQVGATRDGLDPYLDQARRRGMTAVLVETGDYLDWRRRWGRRPFDREIAVDHPEDPVSVVAALREAGVAPALVLTGFERYVGSGFAVAALLGVAPWPAARPEFTPPGKAAQRAALTRSGGRLRQPGHAHRPGGGEFTGLDGLRFPQVVKPSDGGGGLGVYLVDDEAGRDRAVAAIDALTNYGGGAFAGIVVEEFVKGVEHSVQGVAIDGRVLVLSTCEKIIAIEPADVPGLDGFRELGHICSAGVVADPALLELARDCLAATGYREGPFHIDVMWGADGPEFLEMGFRLSGGGLHALVERATGLSWADVVFAAHLGERLPDLGGPGVVAGHLHVRTAGELAAAEELGLSVTRFEAPPTVAGEPAPLASDRLRHTAYAGRVVVTGTRPAEVRAQLEALLTGDRPCAD